jgi:hypothetical protein
LGAIDDTSALLIAGFSLGESSNDPRASCLDISGPYGPGIATKHDKDESVEIRRTSGKRSEMGTRGDFQFNRIGSSRGSPSTLLKY